MRGNIKNINLWFFIVLLIFSIVSYTLKENVKLGMVEEISVIVLYPLHRSISFLREINLVHKKNLILKKRIAMISLMVQRCNNIKKENEVLRRLFGFKPMKNFDLTPCEIIGKTPGLYNRSLIINGGYEDKIEKNLPVIAMDGLVGKVIETTKKTSEVLTLYNRNSYISALDVRSRVQGIIKWREGRYLNFDDVSLHSDVRIGDTIATSGMGGIYPKGIFIGVVKRIEENPSEIVMTIKVQPFVNFTKLEDVFVIAVSKFATPFLEYNQDMIKTSIRKQFNLFPTIEIRPLCFDLFNFYNKKLFDIQNNKN